MSQQASATDQAHEAMIESLLADMTLAEKIGQMTQPEKNSIPAEDVTTYAIGSVLSGGGGNPDPNNPQNWAKMVREFQDAAQKTRLRIPLIYGVDAVHGHSNLRGSVIFPHNIGLGAAHDAELIERIAQTTAREMLATGVHWNFAPAVSIPQDIRWGRTYEGYSENTEIVTELGTAYVRALQSSDPRALVSVKHFAADGGTAWGTTRTYDWLAGNWQAPDDSFSIDQGDAQIDEETLRAIHLPPYIAAIEAGAQNIMISFSSWNGVKLHAHRYLLTDVLKGEFGFEGFLVSDWMAVSQIDRDYSVAVEASINAGIDMVMVPYDYKQFITTLTELVEAGRVSMERIDDAVRRILRVKAWLGMFENPFGHDNLLADVGSTAHREVAREAVRKSLVLLKHEGDFLPLPKDARRVLLAGVGADDIGMQCGGWTIDWQGGRGAITTGTSILAGLEPAFDGDLVYSPSGDFGDDRAEIGIVVIGEPPYAEGFGDNATLAVSDEDAALVTKVRAQCDKLIVILLSGRPLLVADQVAQADAFIAAWLPGSEAGNGIADVLFGDYPFVGKSSYSFPRSLEQVPLTALKDHPEPPLFPIGAGIV